MKTQLTKLFLGLTLTLGALSSANSYASDPCEPTVRAMDSYMGCRDEARDIFYDITFQTMMSSPACPYESHVEVTSAVVKIGQGRNSGTAIVVQIQPGYFKAHYSSEDASFASEIIGLDLHECAVPMHGGLSAGN